MVPNLMNDGSKEPQVQDDYSTSSPKKRYLFWASVEAHSSFTWYTRYCLFDSCTGLFYVLFHDVQLENSNHLVSTNLYVTALWYINWLIEVRIWRRHLQKVIHDTIANNFL